MLHLSCTSSLDDAIIGRAVTAQFQEALLTHFAQQVPEAEAFLRGLNARIELGLRAGQSNQLLCATVMENQMTAMEDRPP